MDRLSVLSVTCLFLLAMSFLVAALEADIGEAPAAAPTYLLGGGEGSVLIEECPRECERRCSLTSRQRRCLFYCNLCCKKCLCVPSGTYGHKEECPCYNNSKTRDGKPKCP